MNTDHLQLLYDDLMMAAQRRTIPTVIVLGILLTAIIVNVWRMIKAKNVDRAAAMNMVALVLAAISITTYNLYENRYLHAKVAAYMKAETDVVQGMVDSNKVMMEKTKALEVIVSGLLRKAKP